MSVTIEFYGIRFRISDAKLQKKWVTQAIKRENCYIEAGNSMPVCFWPEICSDIFQ